MSKKNAPIKTSEVTRLPPCGPLRRLASMIYDLLLVIALLMVATAAVIIPTGAGIEPGTLWFQGFLLIIWWGYFALCWRMGGQTVGMRAWRVELVTDRGERVGWIDTALRFFVAGLSVAVAGLGFVWSLFDTRRRTWHDLATSSQLVVLPRDRKR